LAKIRVNAAVLASKAKGLSPTRFRIVLPKIPMGKTKVVIEAFFFRHGMPALRAV
jgi:hypothetical protein